MAAEEGQVIGWHTVEAWNEQLDKANLTKQLMVVDFTASWCGPCRFIAPFLAELAKKLPHVIFVKVDVDELNVNLKLEKIKGLKFKLENENPDEMFAYLQSVAQDWAVEAMPKFMFLIEGKIVDKVVGAKKDELQQTIAKHLASASV